MTGPSLVFLARLPGAIQRPPALPGAHTRAKPLLDWGHEADALRALRAQQAIA